jgi:polyphosphate kinase
LYHRVEIAFPILNKTLARRIKKETLSNYLHDNLQAWLLQSDGNYTRLEVGSQKPHRAQSKLLEMLAAEP